MKNKEESQETVSLFEWFDKCLLFFPCWITINRNKYINYIIIIFSILQITMAVLSFSTVLTEVNQKYNNISLKWKIMNEFILFFPLFGSYSRIYFFYYNCEYFWHYNVNDKYYQYIIKTNKINQIKNKIFYFLIISIN